MLEKKILDDYNSAMKNKDTLTSTTLSYLRAQILNLAIAKNKTNLNDEEIIGLIRKEVKLRQEAIKQFKEGKRLDLAEKEEKELEVLKRYLPQELSLEELKKIIEEIIIKVGAKEIKDMGKVMKELVPQVSARADSKLLSDLVKQRLSEGKFLS